MKKRAQYLVSLARGKREEQDESDITPILHPLDVEGDQANMVQNDHGCGAAPLSEFITPSNEIYSPATRCHYEKTIEPVSTPSSLRLDCNTPKQYTYLERAKFNECSPFSMNLNPPYSEPPADSYSTKIYTQGPRSACLPLRESPVIDLDINIPSITASDFDVLPVSRPSSSANEEPSSTDDFRASETSWIPDSDHEYVTSTVSRKKVCQISDSDATSASSPIARDLELESPSLLHNQDCSTTNQPLATDMVTSTICEDKGNEVEQKNENKRWKKADPSKWKINLNKKNKHECLPYQDKLGKTMSAKLPKPVNCGANCRFDCFKFTESDRKMICKSFWLLTNYTSQKQFILTHVKEQKPKRQNLEVKTKNRRVSREYYLIRNGIKTRVCSIFFMRTLSVSNGPINNAFKFINEYGTFVGSDNRGRRSPKNKSAPEDVEFLKAHIESFPKMESHYCRQSSKRLYLDKNLSIAKMYQLYKQTCMENTKNPLSKHKYRAIFGSEYNYSFYTPKKDQCSICRKYQTDSVKYETVYKEHQQRKISSNTAKQLDKERSITDNTFLSVTADLQSVLQIPSGDVGELYYTRKLCVYNFTVYETKPPNKGFCMLWNELNGKRGSSEIATCLKKWLDTIPQEIKEVSIFSDTCSGQNRNQYMSAFFLNIIQTSHLNVIEQKFLESGHTMMEVDSMHSAIELERRKASIYSMNDWKNVVKRARSNRHRKDALPYEVHDIKYHEIIDVKKIAAYTMSNKILAQDDSKVQWLKIKCLRYEKENPGIIKFRYDHIGDYLILDTKDVKKTRNNTKKTATTSEESTFPKAYTSLIPIAKAKKNDLLILCKKDIIPEELHPWFESLPVSKSDQNDRLPEPDVYDTDDEHF